MVKTTEGGALVAPFLMKCYEMVEDRSTDALISWCPDGDSFVIFDVSEFESQLLPKYFKHRNFSSFIRQLNIYGFRKIDTDRWIFSNEGFIKGQKHLLKNISRRKQSQAIVQQAPLQQNEDKSVRAHEEEQKFNRLCHEVECLIADKNSLTQELAKLRQHQENSESKLVVLREQIRDMEKEQQQMLSFIVMVVQNPGFLVHILQPKESNWQRAETNKRSFNRVIVDDQEQEVPAAEGMIVKYQGPVNQSCTQLNSEKSQGQDNSNDELNDFFLNLDFTSEPMDDLSASETNGPIVISDLPDDYLLMERFLLSSPSPENNEDCGFDTGEYGNLKMEKGLAFGSELDADEKLEMLAGKMGQLASECNITNQN